MMKWITDIPKGQNYHYIPATNFLITTNNVILIMKLRLSDCVMFLKSKTNGIQFYRNQTKIRKDFLIDIKIMLKK